MTERYLVMPRGINRYLVNFLSGEPDPEVARALLGENHSPRPSRSKVPRCTSGLRTVSRR